ncbi:MAG: ABC transporter permease [Candidatus Thorarchaeota archaeon]|nr:MAG: ABC transporter permease [Candidatus Thorarchaeota archaeon]
MSKVGTKKNTKLWRIWSMFLKELRLIQNDKFALLLIFILPTMIMGTMYIATNPSGITIIPETGKNPDAARIGVVDLDPTNTFPAQDLSANFTWYLTNNPDFIVQLFDTEVDALDALYFDRVNAYVIIPYGFEGNITGDIPAFVDIHVSSTDFESQMSITSAFNRVVHEFRSDHGWSQREIGSEMVSEFQPPGGGGFEATFGVFMIVFSVFIAVAATAAQAIVGDVPLNRMLLTPATKMEAILAKVSAYFVVGMVQAQFLLVLWQLLFEINAWGVYHILNFVLALMSFSGAALGVLISTLVTTRLQANQSFLFLLFGSVIVGTGFMDVGLVDDYYPLNLGRVMMTDTAFKGVGILEFIDEIYIIVIMSLIFLLIAWLIFVRKKTLA